MYEFVKLIERHKINVILLSKKFLKPANSLKISNWDRGWSSGHIIKKKITYIYSDTYDKTNSEKAVVHITMANNQKV